VIRIPDRPLFPDFLRDVRGEVRGGRRTRNLMLAHLPPALLTRLRPYFSVVHLRKKEVLFRAHEPLRTAFFPCSALISLVTTLESGQSLAVGWIGREGIAGAPADSGMTTMPCEGLVQIAGVAERISVEVLRHEMLSDERCSATVGRYAHLALARSLQIAACNMFHPVEQRCIRWLLTISDLQETSEIALTHDQLANMLGVHRPTVTQAIRGLHNAGLVSEARGRVAIVDRDGLERQCCECRNLLKAEQQRLLGY
jgi:CRP-like cAMP-binding protein